MTKPQVRLFVCYIPALDRRLVSVELTPFVHRLLADYPSVRIRTLPTTELVPTMITGVWPHEHQIWQVSLNDEVPKTWATRLLKLMPDWVTTTYGCCRHLFYSDYDLAAIPWRRRRHFNQHRFKYTRRQRGDLTLDQGSQAGTLFNWLGDQARYIFAMHFADIPKLQASLPTGYYALEFLEFYAFDLLSHWNLDRPTAMRKHLHIVDNFVRTLHHRCQQKGVTMIFLVDHGQELVQRSINLKRKLKQTGVLRNEYHYFIEVGVARLWFKTEPARRELMRVLENTPHLYVYTWEQMHQFNVCFKDNRFGDVYLITDHGYRFFPHDFYQPLANFYLGLTSREQRPRIFNPRHRANHGHLPDHPAEEGYIVLADPHYRVETDWMSLIDFAPTVLDLLGRDKPDVMRGRPVFKIGKRS